MRFHRRQFATSLVLLLLLLLSGSARAREPEVVLGVDPRVELLSIVFRLAGSMEYSMGALPGYNEAIDRYFANVRDHDAVRLARAYRDEDGISFDAVMAFAIHIGPLPALERRIPFDAPYSALDKRWRPERADSFLVALRNFAVDADVPGFFRSQGAMHDAATARLERLARERVDLGWFERFFGARPSAEFHLVPALGNGGASYGPRFVQANGEEELYAIIGVGRTDSLGIPQFDDGTAATIAHEFSHSFVNPVIHRASGEFRGAETTYRQVRELMEAQAYATSEAMVDESLVRAATLRWTSEARGDSVAHRETIAEEARGFLWIDELADTLGAWEHSRPKGESFADFAPRLAAWFNALGSRVPALRSSFDSHRPRIVAMTPASGDSLVAPGLTRLTIRFDRPMVRGWSFNVAPQDTDRSRWPNIKAPDYDSTGTVLTATVALEPGRDYVFLLNGPTGGGFLSSDSYPLAATTVEFRTRKSR